MLLSLDVTFWLFQDVIWNVFCQGHDCCPMLFSFDDGGTLTFVSKLDIPKQSIQRNISAMERFRNMDKRATTEDRNSTLETLHQNSITYVYILASNLKFGKLCAVLLESLFICSQVSIYEGDKRDCRKFCTTGIDGAMTIWDIKVCIVGNKYEAFSCTLLESRPLTQSSPFFPQTLESSIQGLRIM